MCMVKQTNYPSSEEYAMPWVPLLPALGIIGNNALVASFDGITFLHYLIFTVIGTLIYLLYGMNNSELEPGSNANKLYYDKDIQMHDYAAEDKK